MLMDDFEKKLLSKIEAIKLKKFKGAPKTGKNMTDRVSRAGQSRKDEFFLKPKERETIKAELVMYYGSSKVDRMLFNIEDIKDLCDKLKVLRDRMLKEMKADEEATQQYHDNIKMEYAKIGRPKSTFNWTEFDYLCSIHCQLDELAGFFGVSKGTIQNRVQEEWGVTFSQYFEGKSQGIKVSLRRAQIRNAIGGDTQMQKFLGKNMLGQKDKVEFDGQLKINSFVDLVRNLENKINEKEEKG